MGIGDLREKKILLDACVLLCGLEHRDNPVFSFQNMRRYFMDTFFDYFKIVLIHDAIIHELDKPGRMDVYSYIQERKGPNLQIVHEDGLYGTDPLYTQIFTDIGNHYVFGYERSSDNLFKCPGRNRGEIASLAYAAYNEIPYFITKDESVFTAQEDLPHLNNIKIIGLEIMLGLGYIQNESDPEIKKALKSLYKSGCYSSIRRKRLPPTLLEYLASKQWEQIYD